MNVSHLFSGMKTVVPVVSVAMENSASDFAANTQDILSTLRLVIDRVYSVLDERDITYSKESQPIINELAIAITSHAYHVRQSIEPEEDVDEITEVIISIIHENEITKLLDTNNKGAYTNHGISTSEMTSANTSIAIEIAKEEEFYPENAFPKIITIITGSINGVVEKIADNFEGAEKQYLVGLIYGQFASVMIAIIRKSTDDLKSYHQLNALTQHEKNTDLRTDKIDIIQVENSYKYIVSNLIEQLINNVGSISA